jgi:hypothetical protein
LCDRQRRVDQLQRWVSDGTLRFILARGFGGMMSAAQQERQQWIERLRVLRKASC